MQQKCIRVQFLSTQSIAKQLPYAAVCQLARGAKAAVSALGVHFRKPWVSYLDKFSTLRKTTPLPRIITTRQRGSENRCGA